MSELWNKQMAVMPYCPLNGAWYGLDLFQACKTVGWIHAINLITSGLRKIKQSKSHTTLTTLCSRFLLSYGNWVTAKSTHWWLRSCDLYACIEKAVLVTWYPQVCSVVAWTRFNGMSHS